MAQSTNDFVTYFKYGYYFGIVPFQYIKNESGAEVTYRVTTNWKQMMFCAVMHLLAFVYATAKIVVDGSQSGILKIMYYFGVVQSVSVASYLAAFYLCVWKIAWSKSSELVSQSEKYNAAYGLRNRIQKKVPMLCMVAMTVGIVIPVVLSRVTDIERYGGICKLLEKMTNQAIWFWCFGKTCFIFDMVEYEIDSTFPSCVKLSAISIIVSHFYTRVCFYCTMHFANVFLLTAVLTLKDASDAFLSGLIIIPNQEQVHVSDNPLLEQFKCLKRLCKEMNHMIGPVVFWFVLVCMSSLSDKLDSILKNLPWSIWIINCYTTWIYAYFFINGAQICGEMERFREFLFHPDNMEFMPSDMKMRLVMELAGKPVGIRAARRFVIDNGFLTNMLTTLMTLLVIVKSNSR